MRNMFDSFIDKPAPMADQRPLTHLAAHPEEHAAAISLLFTVNSRRKGRSAQHDTPMHSIRRFSQGFDMIAQSCHSDDEVV
jgi:hypothetical protein